MTTGQSIEAHTTPSVLNAGLGMKTTIAPTRIAQYDRSTKRHHIYYMADGSQARLTTTETKAALLSVGCAPFILSEPDGYIPNVELRGCALLRSPS